MHLEIHRVYGQGMSLWSSCCWQVRMSAYLPVHMDEIHKQPCNEPIEHCFHDNNPTNGNLQRTETTSRVPILNTPVGFVSVVCHLLLTFVTTHFNDNLPMVVYHDMLHVIASGLSFTTRALCNISQCAPRKTSRLLVKEGPADCVSTYGCRSRWGEWTTLKL